MTNSAKFFDYWHKWSLAIRSDLKFTGFKQKKTLLSLFELCWFLHQVLSSRDFSAHQFWNVVFFFVCTIWQLKYDINTWEAEIPSFIKEFAAVILSAPKAKILKYIVEISQNLVSMFRSNFKWPKIIPEVCMYTILIRITRVRFSFKKNVLFVRNNENLKISWSFLNKGLVKNKRTCFLLKGKITVLKIFHRRRLNR